MRQTCRCQLLALYLVDAEAPLFLKVLCTCHGGDAGLPVSLAQGRLIEVLSGQPLDAPEKFN